MQESNIIHIIKRTWYHLSPKKNMSRSSFYLSNSQFISCISLYQPIIVFLSPLLSIKFLYSHSCPIFWWLSTHWLEIYFLRIFHPVFNFSNLKISWFLVHYQLTLIVLIFHCWLINSRLYFPLFSFLLVK